MTLQNEEAMLKTLKSMINKLNRPVHYVSNFHRKTICVIYMASILPNIEKVEIPVSTQ